MQKMRGTSKGVVEATYQVIFDIDTHRGLGWRFLSYIKLSVVIR